MFRVCCSFIFVALLLSAVFTQDTEKLNFFSKFNQSDYHLVVERTELVRYSKTFMKHAEIRSFKYNRTIFADNITFQLIQDLGNDLIMVMQIYKFMSNEYRYFPMHLQLELCDALDNNLMGMGNFGKCGNLLKCPLTKGTYHICNHVVDENKYPPLIPTGRYMMELQGMHFGSEVFLAKSYAEVKRSLIGK